MLVILCNSCLSDDILCLSLYAGFCSNGEFNSLRVKGNTRPVSIFEIRRLSRKKYSQFGFKRLIAMLTPKCEYAPELDS